jgi:hypothetical protein
MASLLDRLRGVIHPGPGGGVRPLTDEEKIAAQDAAANRNFLGATPGIAKAYENDPRTALGNNALAAGSDTSPLAGGYAEGISRIAQGLAGGYMAKKQREEYNLSDKSAQRRIQNALREKDHLATQAAQNLPTDTNLMGGQSSFLGGQAPAPGIGVASVADALTPHPPISQGVQPEATVPFPPTQQPSPPPPPPQPVQPPAPPVVASSAASTNSSTGTPTGSPLDPNLAASTAPATYGSDAGDVLKGLPVPVKPMRPTFGAAPTSARMNIVRNLLQDTDPDSAAIVGLAMQPFLDKGLTEEMDIAKQREADTRALDTQEYGNELGIYSHMRNTANDLPFSERQAVNANTRVVGREREGRDFTRKERIADQVFRAGESQKERDSREALADKAAETKFKLAMNKVPPGIRKEFRDNVASTMKINRLMTMIQQHPNEVGVFQMLPEQVTSRASPEGRQMRALLSDFGSKKMHDRSGAAVTIEEFARQRGWYPDKGDNAATLKDKFSALLNGIADEQAATVQVFGDSVMYGGDWGKTSGTYTGGRGPQADSAAEQAAIDKWAPKP